MKDPQITMAQRSIDEKHTYFGGNEGLLGKTVNDVCECQDRIGYYKTYEHGRIYWTFATGALAVYGKILMQWGNLGYEQSQFGYPISDEKQTVSGDVRYYRFQQGIIYNSPDFEVQAINLYISRESLASCA